LFLYTAATRLADDAAVGRRYRPVDGPVSDITHNRILTPSLMGLMCSMYCVQSLALFLWGWASLTALPLPLRLAMRWARGVTGCC